MIIAKVVGSAVATLKHDLLETTKLLLVGPADIRGNLTGELFLAVDLVGAGDGELVMICQGSSARAAVGRSAGAVPRRTDARAVRPRGQLAAGPHERYRHGCSG